MVIHLHLFCGLLAGYKVQKIFMLNMTEGLSYTGWATKCRSICTKSKETSVVKPYCKFSTRLINSFTVMFIL